MAKSIDLGAKKALEAKQEKEKQEALRARATGAAPKKALPPPPQPKGVKLPPGVTGQLPLPSGHVVGMVAPSSLTETERATLEAVGWDPSMPIPDNLASVIGQELIAKKAQMDEVILPIDPMTPPVKVNTKDINKLPPEEQKRFRELIKQTAKDRREDIAQQQEAARLEASSTKVPGLKEALAATNAASAFSAQQAPEAEIAVEDDVTQAPAQAAPRAAQAAPDASGATLEAPGAIPAGDTGADVHPAFCPHCSFDLSRTDVIEPAYGEKMAFLHSVLGQKNFSKEYTLFGGNVVVTFRTLTLRELDVVFAQAWRDGEAGKITNTADHYERVNRYRMMLQLLSVKSTGPDGFVHDLPDGLSKETNPCCTETWKTENLELQPGETVIPLIEAHIQDEVLKTEFLFRAVNNQCNQFNRLVARLEAMADNSDFWKPTEEQSSQ